VIIVILSVNGEEKEEKKTGSKSHNVLLQLMHWGKEEGAGGTDL
jgi:hypothetical protein